MLDRFFDWLFDRPPWQMITIGILATISLFANSNPAQAATTFIIAVIIGIAAGLSS